MTLKLGRITVWAMRGPSRRAPGSKVFARGPYGSWTFSWPWSWWTMQAWRRYPDDRLRCNRCGYRKNDS